MDNITEILIKLNDGDKEALEQLVPLVYSELHKIAHRYLQRESETHTLQTTALVHEAYLKLIDQNRINWKNRAQFFGVAANIMRRILIDYARKNLRNKRGGGVVKISIDAGNIDLADDSAAAELIRLDDALNRLAELDPDKARLVELRYFGGLSIEETAEVMSISTATVTRQWRVVKAWLYDEIIGE